MFIEIIPDTPESNSEGVELAQFPDLGKHIPVYRFVKTSGHTSFSKSYPKCRTEG